MPDSMDFSSGPAVSFEGPSCVSCECWAPSCCTPSFSSSFDSSASVARTSSTLELNTGSLYGATVSGATATNIDSHKSAGDLVKDGTFVQSKITPRADQNDRQAGEQPKIIVTNDANVTPDFIVKKDGKVEVVGDPDAGDKAHGVYRIQVEPGADQKATDDLVSYLNQRIQQKEPGASPSLSAAEGLVSDNVKNQFTVKPDDKKPDDDKPPEDEPPPDEPSPNCPGGGGGGGGGDNPPPPDDTPPEENPDKPSPQPDAPPTVPTSPMDNLLDAARLNNWDNNTNGALGAYEINACNWFSSFLDDDMMAELGNPPDYRKLGKVLAKHKNDPKFKANMQARMDNMKEQGDTAGADKISGLFDRLSNEKEATFAENFGIFLNGQRQGGRNATGEEMNQFFDKDLQKAIASSRIADIAHDNHVKVKDLPAEQAAKIALAGALGHAPSEKEQADYAKYMQVVLAKFKPNKPNA